MCLNVQKMLFSQVHKGCVLYLIRPPAVPRSVKCGCGSDNRLQQQQQQQPVKRPFLLMRDQVHENDLFKCCWRSVAQLRGKGKPLWSTELVGEQHENKLNK